MISYENKWLFWKSGKMVDSLLGQLFSSAITGATISLIFALMRTTDERMHQKALILTSVMFFFSAFVILLDMVQEYQKKRILNLTSLLLLGLWIFCGIVALLWFDAWIY